MSNSKNANNVRWLSVIIATISAISLAAIYVVWQPPKETNRLIELIFQIIPSAIVVLIAIPIVYFIFDRKGIYLNDSSEIDANSLVAQIDGEKIDEYIEKHCKTLRLLIEDKIRVIEENITEGKVSATNKNNGKFALPIIRKLTETDRIFLIEIIKMEYLIDMEVARPYETVTEYQRALENSLKDFASSVHVLLATPRALRFYYSNDPSVNKRLKQHPMPDKKLRRIIIHFKSGDNGYSELLDEILQDHTQNCIDFLAISEEHIKSNYNLMRDFGIFKNDSISPEIGYFSYLSLFNNNMFAKASGNFYRINDAEYLGQIWNQFNKAWDDKNLQDFSKSFVESRLGSAKQ